MLMLRMARPVKFTLTTLLFLFLISFAYSQPNTNFSASNTAICIGQSTSFTNTSTGTVTSYSWNFGAGASPATANTAGPHNVVYTTGGAKTVTLTVTGPSGSDTETKTNYVTVGFDRVTIMSYNLLNYQNGTSDTTVRNPYLRTIFSNITPDILVVQEIQSLQSAAGILTNVLNVASSGYGAGTFINGFDSDNAIFFKTSRFTFISNTPIQTDLRDINEFKLVHNLTGDTLRVYSLHLKSSSTSSDEAQRAREIDSLRKVTNALPAGKNFIVVGDFNIYGSFESAYQKLLEVTVPYEGQFYDPLALTGTWNNGTYAQYHTQSPRDTSLGDGGATGGLDDRFDMILFSSAINLGGGMSYVPGSTTAYGNDGLHYNKSILASPTNTSVPADVLTALYYQSDHLPVYANFDFQLNSCSTIDVGAQQLTSPEGSICPSPAKQMIVRIKNYVINSHSFSTDPVQVVLEVTKPNLTTSTFTKTLSAGTLAGGASIDVLFDNTLDMTATGNYSFDAWTVLTGDVNTSNDSMPTTIVNVGANGIASVTPPGPISFCQGDSVTLTAGSGTNYMWSTGATTQSIVVKDAGSYTITLTDLSGCLALSDPVVVTVNSFQLQNTVFVEDMGVVTGTTSIATHESNDGFANDDLTMSGTGDVRITVFNSQVSNSGGANVFLTNVAGRYFNIADINTSGLSNLVLSFGVQKNLTASNGSDLLVQVSTDGVNYTDLSFPPLATGSGTTAWQYVTCSGTIPSSPTLNIQFKQGAATTQYRIDDVVLSYIIDTPTVSADGPLTFCAGGQVTLTSSPAPSYLWSTGATTQSIIATTTGSYYVVHTSPNGCTASSEPVNVVADPCGVIVNVNAFIEGFYLGGGMMRAVAVLGQNADCDTLVLELASNSPPYSILYSDTGILQTNGFATFDFPGAISGQTFYLVLRHRNALETWSMPVTISGSVLSYSFIDAATKAYGSNLISLGDGNFGLYSGDVNQDGIIDGDDYDSVINSLQIFETGYLSNDLTGDWQVESSDFSLLENHISVLVARP